MADETLFQLPVDPDQFSVLLPPAELRKIDFSALEFATARRAIIEYIKTYYPNDFNDFVSNNGVIMLVELLSYVTGVQSLRGDMLANQGFLPTATSLDAVINHLALINQKIRRATPAVVDMQCSVVSGVGSDIRIPARLQFTIQGQDGPITYEIFRAPNDLTSDIVIPSGKRGVIAYGIEGKTETTTISSDGTANQKIIINSNENVIENPININVVLGESTEEWSQVDSIELAGPNDKAYEVRFFDFRVEFIFGDNNAGAIPDAGADIIITYRLGGGSKGRIGAGVIDVTRSISPQFPFTAAVQVNFTNITPSSGGVDAETIQDAKKRAPREYATHLSAVTADDYAQLLSGYNSPIFGSVAKSVAAIRTSRNANLVELYVLANGVDGPITPNEGLKRAIKSYIEELNVLTDCVDVCDAGIYAVDIEMTVVVSKSADASVVKINVENAITDFFSLDNWELGQPLYVSSLYDAINAVDGVKYVDIFKPIDNILATGKIVNDESVQDGININELVTLGNKQITYYYESF
jgi:hypothetical protein